MQILSRSVTISTSSLTPGNFLTCREVISYSAPVISGPVNKSNQILFTEIRQVPDTLATVARATDPRVPLEKISMLEQNPHLDNGHPQVLRLEI